MPKLALLLLVSQEEKIGPNTYECERPNQSPARCAQAIPRLLRSPRAHDTPLTGSSGGSIIVMTLQRAVTLPLPRFQARVLGNGTRSETRRSLPVTTKQDEDSLLRSAALQTANSILIARQRAAQRSEFYFAEGQRLAHMGSWAFSPSGFFDYWSPELFRIYGLDPAKGPPTVDEYLASVHPQDRQFMAKAIEEMLLKGADCDVQQRILRPDGELRHIRWIGVPVLHDGAFNGFVGTALDVTEQEHLAQELRRQGAYLAEAQRLSRTGSFGWSVPTGEILWSEETYRIFQYERTTKPTLELILQRVHPKDLTPVKQTIERALRDGRDFDFEHRLLMPDGSVKRVHIVAHALRDQAGSIEFAGAVMDITAAKEAEEILRQRETELVQLIDVVPQFIFVLAPDGERLYANKVLLDYHGRDFSVDVFRDGSTLGMYCHPEDLELFLRERQHGLARGIPFELEGRQLGNDGRYRWFLFRYNPLRDKDGRILRWYGTATDMDDRKRAEDALRRSEAYLAEAQRLSRTGSFGWNVSSGELFWSEETFRIFGYDRATKPTVQLVLQRVHPDDIALVQQLIECASHDAKDWDLGHRLLMPDGSVKHLHVVAHASRDELGNLEFMGAVMDVTAANRAEEELHRARADLAHATRVTTLGELAASIAHEVNQPVTGVVTNAQAALRWLGGQHPDLEEVRQALDDIIKDGNRAGDVISRIRALVKKVPPRKDDLEINEVILEVIALTHGEVVKNSVSLQTQLAAGLPLIQGDRVQLQQVILNLIVNAIEATSGASEGARELLVRTGKDVSNAVIVAVRDSGPGLDPEGLGRLFDAFYTTKPGGMGMGLSICRSIIEAHGGRLWATPNVPRGAVFQFTLPADGEEVSSPKQTPSFVVE